MDLAALDSPAHHHHEAAAAVVGAAAGILPRAATKLRIGHDDDVVPEVGRDQVLAQRGEA